MIGGAEARMHTWLLLATLTGLASACSNILVTPGASLDGNALVGDNDDSAKRHGLVSHWPAAEHTRLVEPAATASSTMLCNYMDWNTRRANSG